MIIFKGNWLDNIIGVGLLLIPFSTSINSPLGYVVPTGLPFLGIASLYILSLIGVLRYPDNLKGPLLISFLIFLSVVLAILPVLTIPAAMYRALCYISAYLIFLYLMSNSSMLHVSKQQFNKFIMLLSCAGFILSAYYGVNFLYQSHLYGMMFVLIHGRGIGNVAQLPWGASNIVAGNIVLLLFPALYLMITGVTKKIRFINKAIVLIDILVIMITLSRGAILGLLCAVVSFLFITKQKKLLLLAVLMTIILSLLCYLFIDSVHSFVEVFFSRFATHDQLDGRAAKWNYYVHQFIDNPLELSGYYATISKNAVIGSAHNIVLTTLYDRGLIGIVLMFIFAVGLIVYLGKRVWVDNNELHYFYTISFAGVVATFVHLLVEDINLNQEFMFYSWTLLAVIFSADSVFNARPLIKPLHEKQ